MKYYFWTLIGVFAMALTTARSAIIVSNTWESGAESWSIIADDTDPTPFGSITEPSVVGGQNALRITGPAAPGATDADFVFTDNASFIGDWGALGGDGVQSLRMNFYADAGGAESYPAGLRLFFEGDSGNIWFYSVDVTSLDSGWNFLYANIDSGSSGAWWSTTGTEANWATDFANVTGVGAWLAYQTGPGYGSQLYGIDNFELHNEIYIPEPGTWVMLGFAFVSMAVTFRKRLEPSAFKAWLKVKSSSV